MSSTVAGLLQVGALLAVLALVYRPLGDYMARAYTSEKHWRVEKLCYRLVRVDPGAAQRKHDGPGRGRLDDPGAGDLDDLQRRVEGVAHEQQA